MNSNFEDEDLENMREEDLIEILNSNGPSPSLLSAMQQKGLSGSIMTVSSDEEGIQAKEYISYHSKLPKTYPHISDEEIEKAKKDLLDKKSSLEDKKVALITLAHFPSIDAYKALEEYEKDPDKELKVWINMAIQEAQAFLNSDLKGQSEIRIGRVSKVGRNEKCPCGSGKKFKKCCWGESIEDEVENYNQNRESIEVTVTYDKRLSAIIGKDYEKMEMEKGDSFLSLLYYTFTLYPEVERRYPPGRLGMTLNGNPPGEFDTLNDGDEISFMAFRD